MRAAEGGVARQLRPKKNTNIFNHPFSPRRDPGQLIGWVENSAGCEGVGGAGVGHTFTGVICSCREHRQTGRLERRGTDTPALELYAFFRHIPTQDISVAEVR